MNSLPSRTDTLLTSVESVPAKMISSPDFTRPSKTIRACMMERFLPLSKNQMS
ncbi:hypothetical protein SMICM304S_00826 [Streptomyces microflavus]